MKQRIRKRRFLHEKRVITFRVPQELLDKFGELDSELFAEACKVLSQFRLTEKGAKYLRRELHSLGLHTGVPL